MVVARQVVRQLEVGRRLVQAADVCIHGGVVSERVDHADARIHGGVVVVRIAGGAGRNIARLRVTIGGHELRTDDQRPAVGELPAIHRKALDAAGGVVDLLGDAVAVAAVVAVVIAVHRAVPVVQAEQQLVRADTLLVAQRGADVGVIGVDEQAEYFDGRVGTRTVEVDHDLVHDRVKAALFVEKPT